jgi:hypothetical protein
MWTTSMLDYAVLAIELSDLDAAAQLLAIIEPYAGELATSLGPVAAYSGRAASRLGRTGGRVRSRPAAIYVMRTPRRSADRPA